LLFKFLFFFGRMIRFPGRSFYIHYYLLIQCHVYHMRLKHSSIRRKICGLTIQFLPQYFQIDFRGCCSSVVCFVPKVAVKPPNDVQPVLAHIILQIFATELRFHGCIQFRIPTAFYLDDDCYRVPEIVPGLTDRKDASSRYIIPAARLAAPQSRREPKDQVFYSCCFNFGIRLNPLHRRWLFTFLFLLQRRVLKLGPQLELQPPKRYFCQSSEFSRFG